MNFTDDRIGVKFVKLATTHLAGKKMVIKQFFVVNYVQVKLLVLLP